MKIELFEITEKDAGEFLSQDGVRAIDDLGEYRLFGRLTDNVKLRQYGESKEYKLEIQVPVELQCVPCGIKYRTEKRESCPICGTLNRDVMLRNKTFEEPFRKFERIYTDMLNDALRVAQPIMMYVSDNFTEEEAKTAYLQAKEKFGLTFEELKYFSFIFDDKILEKVKALKVDNNNVKTMRILTNGDTSDVALNAFRR